MQQIEDSGKVILKVLCGSRAYGLETSESDFDYHGIYIIPTARFLEIGNSKVNEKAWIEGEDVDNTGWELGHFMRLAVNGNPTALETLVAPVEYTTDEGTTLRSMISYFLSRKRVYEAYRGYAKNQRRKMFEPTGGKLTTERMGKAAIAWLRSLYHGALLLERGYYDPIIHDLELKDFLMEIRRTVGELPLGDIVDQAQELEKEMFHAFTISTIPHEPDLEALNDFLLRIRKENWN